MYTGYIFIDDELFATYTDYSPESVREKIAYITLTNLINQARI